MRSVFSAVWLCGLVSTFAWGQASLTCRRVDTSVTVRSEGFTEPLGDIVLQCSGGSPTKAGSPLPKFQVIVTSTVPLTSRALLTGTEYSGLTEALLLVDEPNFANQIGCETLVTGEACTVLAGTASAPNVFQGRLLQDNSIVFRGVPIDPPGPGLNRTIRIANLRGNVRALATQSPAWGPINTAVQIYASSTGAPAVPIENGNKLAAEPMTGINFAVRSVTDVPVTQAGVPVLTTSPASVPVGAPQAALGFNVKFTETFPRAFRRRNVGTTGDAPLLVTAQAQPGLNYLTESGIYNNLFTATNSMNTAGLADTGTRLRVRFTNIPRDILLWVSVRDVQFGTSSFSTTVPRALLTTTDANGAGALTPVKATFGNYAQLTISNSTATAVWEIVNASPDDIQSVSFAVAISSQNAGPGQGTITVAGALGPVGTAVANASTVPMFADTGIATAALAVSNQVTVAAITAVSAASFTGTEVAPGSIVTGFGKGLSASTLAASTLSLPLVLGDVTVDVIDVTGLRRAASLLYVSAGQVNFLMDPATVLGPALVNVYNNGRLVASGTVQVSNASPSLFSANGDGVGVIAGEARLTDGVRTSTPTVATYDTAGSKWVPVPVSTGSQSEFLFITLYGTGIRNWRNSGEIRARMNNVAVPVTFAGAQGQYSGLDQVNIGPVPKSLAGAGLVNIILSVGDKASNPLQVQIQ